ncbi:PH domain-containing protein [Deinococcus sp. Marseille-Q6407]|uniref:PH domain-containing protein n=1 Tax=Deinococcus sp. Marseille-Q6407 TaxID=2969223 RepID=UPI0021C0EAD1|nr:PH domain-containing protein [Deinococcus sp. Marseille-Q6407]
MTLVPVLMVPALLVLPPLLRLPRYEVSGGQITARSLASRTVIPAGTPVQRSPVTLGGRQVGSAARGYVVGRFGSAQGSLNVYSDGSQGQDALTFATRPRPTLLTPADPAALLDAWRGGRSGTFRPANPPGTDPVLAVLTALLLPLMYALLRPWRLSYALDGDALVVRTTWRQWRLPLASTRAALTRQPLGMRLFGTGMPGYYTGTYASHAVPGGQVQAAASRRRPEQALLLEHGGTTLYLTPADPAAVAGWFGQHQEPQSPESQSPESQSPEARPQESRPQS